MGRTYSVLLLRDDQQVRRFRFNPVWFRLLVYLFILCAVLAAAGIYLSYGYWQENHVLRLEAEQLRRSLQESKVRLASLQNMEMILGVHDPDELQSLLSSARAEQDASVQARKVDLQSIFNRVESDVASVKDVLLKELENGGLRLEFTLTNDMETGKTLTGYVEASCISRDGRLVELTLPQDEMSFHIQRFRTFSVQFSLPQGLLVSDIYALRLLVIAEDGREVFGRAYPMSRFLSS